MSGLNLLFMKDKPVYVSMGKNLPDIKGKVISEAFYHKRTPSYRVQVEYTDLAGVPHNPIITVPASKLKKRVETEAGDTITTPQHVTREQLFAWGEEHGFPELHFSTNDTWRKGDSLPTKLLKGEEHWQRFCHQGDMATVEKALQAALRGTVA